MLEFFSYLLARTKSSEEEKLFQSNSLEVMKNIREKNEENIWSAVELWKVIGSLKVDQEHFSAFFLLKDR